MDIVTGILNLLVIVALIVGAYLAKSYFPSYLSKKAENLATREDLGVITKQVEAIRYEYGSQIESLKGAIGSQMHIYQTRYQNEFNMLKDLSEKIVDLRDSALALRPEIEFVDPSESGEERKRNRLKCYHEAAVALYKVYETRKPFYPDEIYQGVKKLDRIVWREVVEYRNWSDREGRGVDPNYWDKARANAEEISEVAEDLMEVIRVRVKSWESFEFKRF